MLLLDNYNSYKSIADVRLKNWKQLDINTFVFEYAVETDNIKKDGYLSAIFCKCWWLFESSYNKSKLSASVNDAYNWFTDALLYILKTRPWENPTNSLYGKKNAPDVAIKQCVSSRRNTFYQQSNRFNRKINHETESIERLEEITDGQFTVKDRNCNKSVEADLVEETRNIYLTIEEFLAILFDIIYNCPVFDGKEINTDKIVKELKHLDDNYVRYFSKTYRLKRDNVEKTVVLVRTKSKKILKELVESRLQTIYNNKKM